MAPAIKPAEVMREVDEAARAAGSADELMNSICERLHQRMLKYNWVGFYMIQMTQTPASASCIWAALSGA